MPKTKIRPGEVIKRTLQSQSGMSISDLYQTYKGEVQQAREEAASRGDFSQRIMCYESFRKLIWVARRLDFIEEIGRGEPVESPSGKPLLMIEQTASGPEVVPATPLMLALTPAGNTATTPWENLGKAYRQRSS